MMIRVITIDYYSAISGGMRLEIWLHQKKYVQEKNIFYSLSAKYFAANKLEWKVLCRCHRVLAFDALPGENVEKDEEIFYSESFTMKVVQGHLTKSYV